MGGLSTSQIVYEQSVRAMEHQVAALNEIRSRTAVVLAAVGIAASFLGAAAFDQGIGAFGVLAIVFFGASAFCCIWVLLPRWDAWTFEESARLLMPHFLYEPDPEPPDSLYRYLAEQIENHYDANKRELEKLYAWFTWASALLAVDIVLWLLALAVD